MANETTAQRTMSHINALISSTTMREGECVMVVVGNDGSVTSGAIDRPCMWGEENSCHLITMITLFCGPIEVMREIGYTMLDVERVVAGLKYPSATAADIEAIIDPEVEFKLEEDYHTELCWMAELIDIHGNGYWELLRQSRMDQHDFATQLNLLVAAGLIRVVQWNHTIEIVEHFSLVACR